MGQPLSEGCLFPAFRDKGEERLRDRQRNARGEDWEPVKGKGKLIETEGAAERVIQRDAELYNGTGERERPLARSRD
ncbi:hypothetical protein chiPu_0022339 [Chiloscyllium punctatum]|uniref:Uncharacterized protein n=1 Tax=Chiloscyllium punctatum TaxID=137246 RepID=A0A401RIV0_CHIPU|nr:hypothetical protein [Chiloscyllium punctatum]